jgi:hypothetical protein
LKRSRYFNRRIKFAFFCFTWSNVHCLGRQKTDNAFPPSRLRFEVDLLAGRSVAATDGLMQYPDVPI